jgi:hypothetical protein
LVAHVVVRLGVKKGLLPYGLADRPEASPVELPNRPRCLAFCHSLIGWNYFVVGGYNTHSRLVPRFFVMEAGALFFCYRSCSTPLAALG